MEKENYRDSGIGASKPSNRLNVVLSSTLIAWVLFAVIFAPVSFAFVNETNVTAQNSTLPDAPLVRTLLTDPVEQPIDEILETPLESINNTVNETEFNVTEEMNVTEQKVDETPAEPIVEETVEEELADESEPVVKEPVIELREPMVQEEPVLPSRPSVQEFSNVNIPTYLNINASNPLIVEFIANPAGNVTEAGFDLYRTDINATVLEIHEQINPSVDSYNFSQEWDGKVVVLNSEIVSYQRDFADSTWDRVSLPGYISGEQVEIRYNMTIANDSFSLIEAEFMGNGSTFNASALQSKNFTPRSYNLNGGEFNFTNSAISSQLITRSYNHTINYTLSLVMANTSWAEESTTEGGFGGVTVASGAAEAPGPNYQNITACIENIGHNMTYLLQNDLTNSSHWRDGGHFDWDCFNFNDGTENVVIDCQGHSIVGNSTPNANAFRINDTFNLTIKNCIISNVDQGMRIEFGNDVVLENITLSSYINTEAGIYLRSINNSFLNGSIIDLEFDTKNGVLLLDAFNNTIEQNNFMNLLTDSNYSEAGLFMGYQDGSGVANANTISYNTFTNVSVGIRFNNGSGNYIYNNEFINGSGRDVMLRSGNMGNLFYANEFTSNMSVQDHGMNWWNNSVTGNSWLEYDGKEDYGENDACIDDTENGFCDVPYTLDGTGGAVDMLPVYSGVYLVDINVTKISLNESVWIGQNATFVLQVTNNDGEDLTDFVLIDAFNTSILEYAGANVTPDVINDTIGELEWEFNITNGDTMTIVVLLTGINESDNTTNEAFVLNASDYEMAYDEDVVEVMMDDMLVVTKTALNTPYISQEIEYLINVTNLGVTPIYDIFVIDEFNSTFVNFSDSNIAPDVENYTLSEIEWLINLNVSESKLIYANFTTLQAGNTTNFVYVEDDEEILLSESSVVAEILSDVPISASNLTYFGSAAWNSISSLAYAETVEKLSVTCSYAPDQADILNATFYFVNVEDSNYTINGVNATERNGASFVLDMGDVTLYDSGTWYINATCIRSEGQTVSIEDQTSIAWGNLTVNVTNAAQLSAVQKYDYFDFNISVICTGGECQDVELFLDPIKMENQRQKVMSTFNTGSGMVIVKLKDNIDNGRMNSLDKKARAQVIDDNQDTFVSSMEGSFEVTRKYETINALTMKVDEAALNSLLESGLVEYIEPVKRVYASMDEANPRVGTDTLWNYEVNGNAINGSGVTACIIDTGINYSHADFGAYGYLPNAKVLASRCFAQDALDNGSAWVPETSNDPVGWCPNGLLNDTDVMDDHSHGSHVAGILASEDSTYSGAAPGTRLVIIKALAADGAGWNSDIVAGIDWCVNNADTYNISIISMSLGSGGYNSTSACDTANPSYVAAIQAAYDANISVFIAAGNCQLGGGSCSQAYANTVSAPACISHAIPIGATSTTDVMASFSQRGEILSLVAPGVAITATKVGGGHTDKQGTSMATPLAAGVAALLTQYNKEAEGDGLTPDELNSILITNGMPINDMAASGKNYTQIHISDASYIAGLGKGLISTTLGALPFYTTDNNPVTSTDISSLSAMKAGDSLEFSWQVNATGDYHTWEFFAFATDYDNAEFESNHLNLSITDLSVPTVSETAPDNEDLDPNGTIYFNFTLADSFDSSLSCTLYLNGTANESGIKSLGAQTFTVTLPDGNYSWYVNCSDAYGNSDASTPRTLVIDTTYPVTSTIVHSGAIGLGGWYTTDVTLNFSVVEEYLAQTEYHLGSWQPLSGNQLNITSEGNNTLLFRSMDEVGNQETAQTEYYAIDKTDPVVTSFLMSEANGSSINSSLNINFSVTITESNEDVFAFYVNDVFVSNNSFTSTTPEIIFWNDANSYTEQTVNFSIIVYDIAGRNVASTYFVLDILDGVAPSVQLLLPVDGNNIGDAPFVMRYNATDSLSLSSCNRTIFNSSFGLHESSTVSSISNPYDNLSAYNALDGVYYWNVSCIDDSGNVGFSPTWNFTLDTNDATTTDNAPSGWQLSAFYVNFTCTDTLSGCDYTTYSVDGGAWQNGTFVNITSDGNYTILYHSVDLAGNTESNNTVYAALDVSAPSTVLTLNPSNPDGFNDWYTVAPTINLTCSDGVNGSGCNSSYYNLTTNGNFEKYTTGFSASYGNNTVYYYSDDIAGRTETVNSQLIKVDNINPVYSSFGISDTQVNTTEDLTIYATWTDDYLDNVSLYYENGTFIESQMGSTGNFSFTWTAPPQLGGQTVKFFMNATDEAGNLNTTSLTALITVLDTVAPSVFLVSPSVSAVLNYSAIEFSAMVNDNQDLMGTCELYINNTLNATNSSVSEPMVYFYVTLPDGFYDWNISCNDTSGNKDNASSQIVTVDTTPSVSSDNALSGWEVNDFYFYVNFTCTDAVSGCDYTTYKLDSNPWQNETFVNITTEGNHTIIFHSVDLAGNTESNNTVYAALDLNNPVTTLSLSPSSPDGLGGWYTSAPTINLTCADSGSGCNSTYYNLTNSTDFVAFSSAFSAVQGSNTLYYYSDDIATRTETVNSQLIKVDNINPTYSAFNISNTQVNSTENLTIWANWTEDYPSIAILYINGVNEQNISSDLNPIFEWTADSQLAETNVDIHMVFLDLAGNQNQTTNLTVFVRDTTGPVVTLINPTNGKFTDDGTILEFEYNASDNRNLSSCNLSIFNSSNEWIISHAVNLNSEEYSAIVSHDMSSDSDGVYYWNVSCYDVSDNLEISSTWNYTLDTINPSTSHNAPSGWQTSSFYINFTCSDDRSGCAFTELKLDNGSWHINSSLEISEVGNHTVYYASTDLAGNVENLSIIKVALDLDNPTTALVLSPVSPNGLGGWYTSIPTVNLTYSDLTSGGNNTYYNLTTNGDFEIYSAVMFAIYGNNTIYYYSDDIAGRTETPNSQLIKVDNINPTYSLLDISVTNVNTTENVTIYANFTDDYLANVTLYYYNSTLIETKLGITGNFSFEWSAPEELATQSVSFYMTGMDLAGNTNTTSNTSGVTVWDTSAPTITLASPDNATMQNTATVTFIANVTDNLNAVDTCSLFIDNTLNSTISPNTSFVSYGPLNLTEGNHFWNISCNDTSNNVQNTVGRNITIDLTAPSLVSALTSLPRSPRRTLDTATLKTNVSGGSLGNFTLSTPANVITAYDFVKNGNYYHYNFSAFTTLGLYRTTARVYDAAGNYLQQRYNFTVIKKVSSENLSGPVNSSIFINESNEVNASVNIELNGTLVNGSVNMTLSVVSLVNESVSNSIKYVRFEPDSELNLSLEWVNITIYYTTEEVQGLLESGLKVYWFNESSGQWVQLVASMDFVNSTGVDTARNLIWAKVRHFSDYTIASSQVSCSDNTAVPATGCYHSSTLYTTGYICDNAWQSTDCDDDDDGGSGGSGGSGGGIDGASFSTSPTLDYTKKMIYSPVSEGQKITLVVNNDNIAFTQISLTSLVALNSASIILEGLSANPISKLPTGIVYQFIELSSDGFDNLNIEGLETYFAVDEDWMSEENIDPKSLTLYYYNGNSWVEVESSSAPGFGYYAVVGQKKIAEQALVGTNDTVDSNVSTEEPVQNITEESEIPELNPDVLYEPKQPISRAKLWIILLIMLLFLGIIIYIPLHHLKRGKKLYKY